MKKTFAILLTTFISIDALAQNENDALRYSILNYGGTARFAGLSGAYGAVGADFSSLSQNPAGIGIYRRSEFSFTPVISSNNTTSQYLGESFNDSRNTMYLSNVGYVFSQNMKGAGPLVSLQFGFGVNQLARFSNRFTLSGFNNLNSLLTTYVNEVNYTGAKPEDWDNFGARLAYDSYLINYDSTDKMRWVAYMESGGVQQTKTVETSGSLNETVISTGANISDKLFLGITFAFPYIRYEENSIYTEEDTQNSSSDFNSFQKNDYLNTRGSGFNFKAGFIFKPVEFIRIGGAIHTPTKFYNMSDTYHSTINSYLASGKQYYNYSPDGYFEYDLNTPFRAQGNLAVLIGTYGLISADYEYIDYSDARLHAFDYSFSEENKAIRTNYTTASNLRLGAEIKSGIVAFRGGYSFYGTPFRDMGKTGDRNGYSLGIGVRDKGYFVDFAYNHSNTEAKYYLYGTAPASTNRIRTNAYSLSIGLRF